MQSKRLGIIGGMGSMAGADFLRKVLLYSPALSDQDFPEIILHSNSLVPDRTRAIVYGEPSPVPEILRSVDLFNQQKVDLIAIACITSYFFYDEITRHANATVIHPIRILSDAIHGNSGIRKVGVLATTGTIQSGLFHKGLEAAGVEVVTLGPDEQERYFMKALYMEGGLKSSRMSDQALALFSSAVERLKAKDIDVLIGGCSEVSLLLNRDTCTVTYMDPMDLMARAVADLCYN